VDGDDDGILLLMTFVFSFLAGGVWWMHFIVYIKYSVLIKLNVTRL